MSKKGLLALILALLMLLTLFGACKKTEAPKDETPKTEEPKKETPKKEEPKKEDPKVEEPEIKTVHLLNYVNPGYGKYTYEEVLAKGHAGAEYLNDVALKTYFLEIERSNINMDSYLTTLTGFIASKNLPETFGLNNVDAATRYSMVEMGLLANMDDIFALSNGTAYGLYYGDGCMAPNHATNILYDGNWYWWEPGNNNANPVSMADYGAYRAEYGTFTVYPLSIRMDWLEPLGLGLPTDLDSLYEALLAVNENDGNGNGQQDERMMIGVGKGDQYGGNLAGSFGLLGRYVSDMRTGEVLMPELMEGYVPFLQFLKRLYDKNLFVLEEGSTWGWATDSAGNFCSAHYQYPSTMQWGGQPIDAEALMLPVPLFEAFPGVRRISIMQDILGKLTSQTASVSADYEAVARWFDFINGEEYCNVLSIGMKGKAYDVIDGKFVGLDLSEEDAEKGYGNGYSWMLAGYGPQVTLNNVYHPGSTPSSSIDDLLAKGMDNSSWGADVPGSKEQWVERTQKSRPYVTMDTPNAYSLYWEDLAKIGGKNILFAAGDGHYRSYETIEEGQLIAKYNPDLNTHLNEMTSKFMTGGWTADQYDAQVELAFSLGLLEIINMYQTRLNNTWASMGYAPFPLRTK